MFNKTLKSIRASYLDSCQRLGAFVSAPNKAQVQFMLFALGISLLSLGSLEAANATQGGIGAYNDTRLNEAVCIVFRYLEGSFGALVMVASGIGAILSAAFGQYRAALGLMVVAIGSFIIRSLTATFFGAGNACGQDT